MKIFIGSLVILFGTLLAAGMVALGQPGSMDGASHGASPLSPASPGGPAPLQRDDESVWERLLAIRGFR